MPMLICVWVCVCEWKKTRGPSRASYRRLWAAWYGCWEPNLGPLQEQYILNHWASPGPTPSLLTRALLCWGTLTVFSQSLVSSLWTLLSSCLERGGPTIEAPESSLLPLCHPSRAWFWEGVGGCGDYITTLSLFTSCFSTSHYSYCAILLGMLSYFPYSLPSSFSQRPWPPRPTSGYAWHKWKGIQHGFSTSSHQRRHGRKLGLRVKV